MNDFVLFAPNDAKWWTLANGLKRNTVSLLPGRLMSLTKTWMKTMMNKFPISLTPTAVQMALGALKDNQEDGEYLRVSVCGGGCAGLKYGLNFVSQIDEMDLTSDMEGLKVVTDIFTATQIEGTTIDYQETLQGAGFKFVNPSARRTCGCGSSFSG